MAAHARETGRALASIAIDVQESGPSDHRQLFEAFAAATNTWNLAPVPVDTPYYALVAEAYRDELGRLRENAG
jgi:hypothetical protein